MTARLASVHACPHCGTAVEGAEGTFCCHGCEHLGPRGCTVESLYCRLWICEPLQSAHIKRVDGHRRPSPTEAALRKLRRMAEADGFMVFRGTKEESLEKALRKQARLPRG